jgi:hypothetical protein
MAAIMNVVKNADEVLWTVHYSGVTCGWTGRMEPQAHRFQPNIPSPQISSHATDKYYKHGNKACKGLVF